MSVLALLDRLSSDDSDFRFMALSDLHGILSNKSVNISDAVSTLNRVFDGVLRSLADTNAQVQSLAVKCLAPLVARTTDSQLGLILTRLSDSTNVDASLASTALRTTISHASASSGKTVAARVLPVIDFESTDSVDVLVDLINRFGSSLSCDQVAHTQTRLMDVLAHGRGLVRKRAVVALGSLSAYLTPDQYEATIASLETADARMLVAVCASLCKADPARFGPYVRKLVPKVFLTLNEDQDEDDEVREAALIALDTLVLLCANEMADFTKDVIACASKFVKYDPNYADDGDDDDDMSEGDYDEDEDEDDDISFSDDDDVSWKLRRCAAKLLTNLIETRPDLLSTLYTTVAPLLVSRFKEREETVRVQVLQTFASLVRQTAASSTSTSRKRRMSDASMVLETDARGQLPLLAGRVFKLLSQLLAASGVLTKQAAIVVATELVTALTSLPDEFALFMSAIEPAVEQITLRTNIIKFLSALTRLDAIQAYLDTVVPVLITLANDKFYKISGDALAVVSELVSLGIDPKYVSALHDTALSKAIASDTDLEVREQAINVIAQLVSLNLYPEDSTVLLDRLRNETTRPVSIRAIKVVASTDAELVLPSDWVNDVIVELASLLRKSNRQLRVSAIATLTAVVDKFAKQISRDAAQALVTVLQTTLAEQDLQLISPALSILTTLVNELGPLQGPIRESVVALASSTSSTPSEQLLSLLAAQAKHDAGLLDALADSSPKAVAVVMIAADKISLEIKPDVRSLNVIAELARRGKVNVDVRELYKLLEDKDDSVRFASAEAIGAIAATDAEVLQWLCVSESSTLPVALREVIKTADVSLEHTATLWERLFAFDDAVAAECLARLTCLDPAKFVPELRANMTRKIAISAVRTLITIEADENVLSPLLPDFFALLASDDVETRRATLSAVASLAHHRPDLLAQHLQIVPVLIESSVPRPELVREVQMGPFKHKVDDGVDARKAAYDALLAIIDVSEPYYGGIADRAVAGLSDDHEIKITSCVIISKLPHAVLIPRLDLIAANFTQVMTRKFRETEVKQEVERHQELQRHVVRITQALKSAGVVGGPVWTQYVESVKN